MTTEEMMEFYKDAWDKERENSNRLCILKDEAIDKILHLQEQLKECIEFIEVLCDSLDYEGILGDDLKEKLKKMKKWGVK